MILSTESSSMHPHAQATASQSLPDTTSVGRGSLDHHSPTNRVYTVWKNFVVIWSFYFFVSERRFYIALMHPLSISSSLKDT